MVLATGVVLLIIGIAAGYGFGIKLLHEYAIEVSHKKVDALASNSNIQTLQKLDQQLTSYKDALQKAESLKISGEFPEFRIVEEVQSVAKQNGIGISSYNYGGAGDTTTADTGISTTTPGAAPVAGSTQSTSDKISLTVNLVSPVSYKNLLQFLYDVEHHIPKMELDGISISPAGAGNDMVSVQAVSIQMYARK
ncbi:TPA: hypothetical protein DHU97_03555 [Candidatus Saccharibacteria bacterium]|nr:hypothetical protein [Candidatus Saccharibacteria bacterium]